MKAFTLGAALGAALLFASSGADAASLAKACAKDIKSVCADVKPDKRAACMKEHFSELSTDCQIAYVKVAAVGRACKADMKKFCADVKPGKNAKAECLKSHCRRSQRRLQGRDGEGGRRRQVSSARASGLKTRPSSTAASGRGAHAAAAIKRVEIMMKTVVSALLALGLLAGTVAEANAVVCARGVYRAGCAGPRGAVVTRGG